jgi:peroxiredoxin
MRSPFQLTALALVASSSVACSAPRAVGNEAPEFALAATNGKTLHRSDYRGRTLVLAFFPKAFTSG